MPRGRADEAVRWLQQALPMGWTASVARRGSGRQEIRVTSPSQQSAEVGVVKVADANPRSVGALPAVEGPTLIVADWLSQRSQALLRARGFSFIDATGNAEVRLSEPGLFIRTEGAKRNPSPPTVKGPGLRGPKAWALLRTLAEVPPPMGVRELAEAVEVDAGYVSRVLAVLEQELLVTRARRSPVTDVEWGCSDGRNLPIRCSTRTRRRGGSQAPDLSGRSPTSPGDALDAGRSPARSPLPGSPPLPRPRWR